MEEKISCAVCRDLLPLVQDGVASEESAALVRRHLEGCPACRGLAGEGNGRKGEAEPTAAGGAGVFDRVRVTLSMRALALVAVGTAAAFLLRWDETFAYNLILMPAVGAVLYAAAGKKWYLGPCWLGALGALWQLVMLLTRERAPLGDALGPALLMGAAYLLLCLLGGGIAALLRCAFTSGKSRGERKR